ncbi:MAG: hypothetical protein NTZ28_01395, partial [Nitrospirae bacterium]|nr:hypothetical protein [Nitrospirota bacterium]
MTREHESGLRTLGSRSVRVVYRDRPILGAVACATSRSSGTLPSFTTPASFDGFEPQPTQAARMNKN